MTRMTIIVDVPDELMGIIETSGVAMFIPILAEEREQILNAFGGLAEFTAEAPKQIGTVLEATEEKGSVGEPHRNTLKSLLHMSRLARMAVDRLRIIVGRAQFISHTPSDRGENLQ